MSRIAPSLADGRSFTSYLSASQYNDSLKGKFGIENESQYRLFLQANASDALEQTRKLTVVARPKKTADPAMPMYGSH